LRKERKAFTQPFGAAKSQIIGASAGKITILFSFLFDHLKDFGLTSIEITELLKYCPQAVLKYPLKSALLSIEINVTTFASVR
jgi:hypothetical protein